MDTLDTLDLAFDHACGVVAGVDTGQLDAPTPCNEWDLRTLVGHAMGVVANCGRGVSGGELLPRSTVIPLEADLGGQFRAETDRTLAAWMACRFDEAVDIGAGPRPAQVMIGINLLDTTVHSWDIARATGQDPTLPDELATTVLAFSQGFVTDDLRARAGFDPPIPVPDDAAPTDRLVAFLGRQP